VGDGSACAIPYAEATSEAHVLRKDFLMLALIAIPITCWLCALLAIPRRPCPHHEMQEFTYRRLVGRQQLLVGCAIAATVIVAVVHLLAAIVSP
jgi:predicted MFS family arabinose efflux permease